MKIIYYGLLLILIILVIYYCSNWWGNENFMDAQISSKQETYRHLLSTTKDILNGLNIPFFLSSGTCLGYARERNFIEHDYDIDIGIYTEDYKPELIDAMQAQGLYLYRVLGDLQTGLELSFYMPFTPSLHRAKIDIFIHQKGPQKTCWGSYDRTKTKKLEYCVNNFGLEPVDFLGMQVNVPDPVTKYLEEHYGKDWRIPKGNGNYNYSTSPISLTIKKSDNDFWYEKLRV